MCLADARLAASTMISCSMMASLTDMASVLLGLWMMNTSVPRTDSPNRQCSSPLANSARLASTRETPRRSAISSANGKLARPDMRCRRFLVTSSIRGSLLRWVAGLFRAGRSVERAGAGGGRHQAARLEHGEGTDDGVVPDHRVAADAVLDHGAGSDRAVH